MVFQKNATPENPREQPFNSEHLGDIASMSPDQSKELLLANLEKKNERMGALTENLDGRDREIASVAQQSIEERLKLIRLIAA